ncbi:MAG: LPXTG cell wall anchor domain-containing protein, partial [Clostridia bacterium]|nr:LPXTG cell wall anchor domain-containing protein [Clostridia bacterium]
QMCIRDRVYIPYTPPTENTSTSTSETYVKLTVGIEGQGSVLPGTGTYSRSLGTISVFNNIAPADGWKFDGWYGPNGNEVKNNEIIMAGDKSVIARFVPAEVIKDEPIPEGNPVTETAITVTPASVTTEEEVVLDEPVPQDKPVLPKTGGLPLEIILTAGVALSTSGLIIRRKEKKQDD